MDCDNQEIEATKTIGSTDVDKVLKKLKNKHTKESIILLDYIEKRNNMIKILIDDLTSIGYYPEKTQEEIFALYKAKAQVNINMKKQIDEIFKLKE